MREYERFSTTAANAYVQPLMSRYLIRLRDQLNRLGAGCPLFLMTSGGGLTTLETAIRFPVRLVESGPAGGAIFAGHIAKQRGLDRVLSFDMGGTTAKVCLVDHGESQTARAFEVARVWRFKKGSGLPLRIPVHRDDRDRRGRRLDRRGRRPRPPPGRAGERRLGAWPRLLRPRRRAADRDRCRRRARPDRSGALRGIAHRARRAGGGRGDRPGRGPAARPAAQRGAPTASPRWSTATWRTRAACTRSRAARS